MANNNVGSIVSLWRYPVKSMMGEELRSTDMTEGGIMGDRAYALIDDETGKVVSAKNPPKWPNMFHFRSRYIEPLQKGNGLPPVRITLPDGSVTDSNQADANSMLSNALGRSVRLETRVPQTPNLEEYWLDKKEVTDEKMPEGTFFDLAIVHLLTTSTIDELRRLYPQGRFEIRRFRPNIVVNTNPDQPTFAENHWVGKTLTIGDNVVLKVTEPCPRCVMPTLAQGDLPEDKGILSTIFQKNNGHVGIYASVVQGGAIKCGDEIKVIDAAS
ncbi:MOSC domain-containing protein [Candidatus Parabeggiatoa sp. HSG14]|uniref:MOSC domain-containing protein n=1 Tax=Candidatus Parabeggiatoa sp. HSG14 TaxID=3055593 RepID=UPI0025A8CCFA|nr:MOSC domain-containing protein [Thiotrichales bacterium HSG14]